MSDAEDSIKPKTPDHQAEAQAVKGRVFEEFCSDPESIESLGVTAQELQALSRASLLGILNNKEDVMFILRQIRESMKRESQAFVPLGTTHTPVRKVDEPTRDFGKIAETIRSAALVKLDELELKAAIRRKTAVGRLESAWGRVTVMLSRVRSLGVQLSYRLVRRSVISRPVFSLGIAPPDKTARD